MNHHSGNHRCPRPVKGDTGNRAEQIAICLVLALEPGATYHKPEDGYRRRTPVWLVTLQDDRSHSSLKTVNVHKALSKARSRPSSTGILLRHPKATFGPASSEREAMEV